MASQPSHAFAITNLARAREEQHTYLNMLIYGAHGAGKTTLLGSAVDVEAMRDVLVITMEGGVVVFEDNPRINEHELLDVVKIDRIEQFQKLYEFVRYHCQLRDANNEKALLELQRSVGLDTDRVRKYRTVIVDSLSEIEAANLAKILDLDSQKLDAGADLEVAGYPQFRQNLHSMQRIIRSFRDLPINFLTTCSQAYSKDERSAFHYGPKLTGQLSNVVQGFFDVVGWLVPNTADVDKDTGVAKRRLFVQPQTAPKADAKCRLASFKGAYFDDPTMGQIMTKTGYIK